MRYREARLMIGGVPIDVEMGEFSFKEHTTMREDRSLHPNPGRFVATLTFTPTDSRQILDWIDLLETQYAFDSWMRREGAP